MCDVTHFIGQDTPFKTYFFKFIIMTNKRQQPFLSLFFIASFTGKKFVSLSVSQLALSCQVSDKHWCMTFGGSN